MQLQLPPWLITKVVGTASSAANFLGPKLVNHQKLEVTLNIPYGAPRELNPRKLDIYRPKDAGKKILPISILIHGGGFRFFSKDSHALCASTLAQAGQLVFCVDYALTPHLPYPNGLNDVVEAYQWIIEHAASFGGDVNQISLIGESAGSNLSLAICLHPEVASLPKPKYLILGCGHLQVTDVERYQNDPRCFPIAYARVSQIQRDYLPASVGTRNQNWGLANPLVEIERLVSEKKNLPANFPKVMIPVGERDPIINDSERMAQAMRSLGQPDTLKVYPGQGHAFHVFPLKKAAVQAWKDILTFISA